MADTATLIPAPAVPAWRCDMQHLTPSDVNGAVADAAHGASASGDARVVSIDAMVKTYRQGGTRRVSVDGLTLEVARGELFGLIGADGAGKSTVFKSVAGVLSHDAGSLIVLGQRIDCERDAELVKQRIGFMPQGLGLNLYPELSVDENIEFFADLRAVPRAQLQARRARLLAVTQLESCRDRPMKQLSGGMKQKLGLVCTLIHAPELIVLDEPTTGVDPLSRRQFWRLLPELMREGGMTALVATAYLDEADRFDRVALMHAGRLLALGPPGTLAAQLRGTVVSLSDPDDAALARLTRAFGVVDRRGATVSVLVDTPHADQAAARVRNELGAQACPPALQTSAPGLEDLFVARLRALAPTPVPAATAVGSGLPVNAPGPADRGLARDTGGQDVGAQAARSMAAANPATRLAPGPTQHAIEAVELTRDFARLRAVDRVSFRVAPGEIFGLLGANGAGKTTVIKMLTGLLPPSSGMGQVAGADMRRASRQIRQRIGYVSQAFSLYGDLSARENLLLYAGVYGLDRRTALDRVGWAIDQAGLGAHQRDTAASLPMGLRQRLALGCATLHRPQVLFLDEPTSGVDPLGRRQLWRLLAELSRQQQVAILVTTHHMAEADLCDHLVLLFDGRVVADATPAAMKQALRAECGDLLELRCDAPEQALALLRASGHADAVPHGRAIRLMAPEPARAAITTRLATQGITLHDLQVCELGMDEVFVRRVSALQAAP